MFRECTRTSLWITAILHSRASIYYHITVCKFSVESTFEPLWLSDHYYFIKLLEGEWSWYCYYRNETIKETLELIFWWSWSCIYLVSVDKNETDIRKETILGRSIIIRSLHWRQLQNVFKLQSRRKSVRKNNQNK